MGYDAQFRVWRGDADGGALQDYSIPVNEGEVVLDIIHRLQATQTPDLAVRWNCKAGKCGSCSAEINGQPRLMCMTRMSTFTEDEVVTVTPLRAFPVIRDLVTLIVRPEGRLFFVNAQNVADQLGTLIERYQPRVVTLDMSRVPDLEYSALQALIEGEQRMAERGVVVWLAGLNPGVLEMVRHTALADRLGRDRLLFNARVAIERYQAMQASAAA